MPPDTPPDIAPDISTPRLADVAGGGAFAACGAAAARGLAARMWRSRGAEAGDARRVGGAVTCGAVPSERIHYVDWLRVLALAGVFLAHASNMPGLLYQPADAAPPDRAAADASGAAYFALFVPQFGMSVLFLLGGAGAAFVLRSRGAARFVHGRTTRLFVPLAAGLLTIAPLQEYVIQRSDGRFSGSLLDFYPRYFATAPVSWDPRWMGEHAHHLWFLADLFAVSMATLPLCAALEGPAGRACVERLARLAEKPWGPLLFLAPITLAQVGLRARFPAYQGWADVAWWLLFYVYGYLLFGNARLRLAIERRAWLGPPLGLACIAAILALWAAGPLGRWVAAPDYSAACLLFQALSSLTTCAWVLTALFVGRSWLNFENGALRYGTRVDLTFYVLHYPLLVIAAYYALPWRANALVKLLAIGGSALALTLGIAEGLLRGKGLLRSLRRRAPPNAPPARGGARRPLSRGGPGAAPDRSRRGARTG